MHSLPQKKCWWVLDEDSGVGCQLVAGAACQETLVLTSLSFWLQQLSQYLLVLTCGAVPAHLAVAVAA